MIHIGNQEHGPIVAKKAGCVFNPQYDSIVSRQEGDQLYGGVVYQNYTKHSIAMHVAGFVPNWCNRDFLRTIFYYPFVQLGCVKVFGYVPETNTTALKIDRQLGFEPVVFVPDVFATGGMHILAMERTKCRWLLLPPPKEITCDGVLYQRERSDRDGPGVAGHRVAGQPAG